ncbi:hypothetical protein K9L67_04775 [Candidatus Woesearchaeota archaeon]|nr:hypothetical protein [Candidatus Woesearchaeota archaeon]MCF7901514.1 hypothetical protein [Candidatus Woesearchaeota archaeon]MCF8013935.1 hypothetical protein [Candidatus Woesearchaeota archaeon]
MAKRISPGKVEKAVLESENEEKDVKKSDSNKSSLNKAWYYLFAALIVILIVVLIFIFNNDKSNVFVSGDSYNGFVFNQLDDGLWETEIKTIYGDMPVIFHYNPKELETYYFNTSAIKDVNEVKDNNGFFFVALNPLVDESGSVAIAGIEVAKIASKVVGFGEKTKSALTQRDPENPSNVASCEEASSIAYVLEFDVGNESGIFIEPYCARLIGKDFEETVRLADAFAFHMVGVMK